MILLEIRVIRVNPWVELLQTTMGTFGTKHHQSDSTQRTTKVIYTSPLSSNDIFPELKELLE